MRHISHDLVHETGVVPELILNILHVLLGLIVSADADSIVADQEMELENKLKNLIHGSLKAVVSSTSQEALFKNCI